MKTTVSDLKTCVGEGWWPLLQQLDVELAAIFPEYNVVQVKEKFAALRVYLDRYPSDIWEEVNDLLLKYEQMSASICEDCGEPGTLDDSKFWVRTLCGNCKRKLYFAH